MDSMPLGALRAFAAIHECGGIRAAARKLSVTPSSVHRYLREVEATIGAPLTESGVRTVRFTPTGERLARATQESFEALAQAWDAAMEDRRPRTLTLATTTSFAGLWLLPRLGRLRERHPQVELSIRTDQRLSAVPADADLAIRMGAGPWRDAHCESLMNDVLVPVVSSVLLRGGRPREARDILSLPRLHDRDSQASWRRWGLAMGIPSDQLRSGPRLSSSDLVLAAAAHGLGVALGRLKLATPAIDRGDLVALSEFSIPIGPSYWLIRPITLRSIESAFREWLLSEVASDDAVGATGPASASD